MADLPESAPDAPDEGSSSMLVGYDISPSISLDRIPGMPRRPGTYPPDWPLERQNRKVIPNPGHLPKTHSRASSICMASAPNVSLPTPPAVRHNTFVRVQSEKDVSKFMDRKTIQRGVRQTIEGVQSNEFPPLSVKPPKFKNKGFQYPSGNATGTESFMPFEAKLKEVMIGGKAAPKK
jgi:hypothetical protein